MNLDRISQEVENRIIKKQKFIPKPTNQYSLKDKVIVYKNGKLAIVVPIEIMIQYPVIQDLYFQRLKIKDGDYVMEPITITFCPYSGTSIGYFGTYSLTNKIHNCNIILQDSEHKDIIIHQLSGQAFSKTVNKPIKKYLRKLDVQQMDLRNALTKFPDCKYLDTDNIKKLEPLIPHNYFETNNLFYSISTKGIEESLIKKYHPKTLVFGIEYKSSNFEDNEDIKNYNYKYSVIVSNDSSKDEPNSVNLRNNGITKYFDSMIEEIREKAGVIIPSFWPVWITYYPNSKIIEL